MMKMLRNDENDHLRDDTFLNELTADIEIWDPQTYFG